MDLKNMPFPNMKDNYLVYQKYYSISDDIMVLTDSIVKYGEDKIYNISVDINTQSGSFKHPRQYMFAAMQAINSTIAKIYDSKTYDGPVSDYYVAMLLTPYENGKISTCMRYIKAPSIDAAFEMIKSENNPKWNDVPLIIPYGKMHDEVMDSIDYTNIEFDIKIASVERKAYNTYDLGSEFDFSEDHLNKLRKSLGDDFMAYYVGVTTVVKNAEEDSTQEEKNED